MWRSTGEKYSWSLYRPVAVTLNFTLSLHYLAFFKTPSIEYQRKLSHAGNTTLSKEQSRHQD